MWFFFLVPNTKFLLLSSPSFLPVLFLSSLPFHTSYIFFKKNYSLALGYVCVMISIWILVGGGEV